MALTYEPIATSNPSGLSTVTFSSIPQTYTDLRIITSGYTAGSGAVNPQINMRINGATAAAYDWQLFRTTGTTGTQFLFVNGNTQVYLTDTSQGADSIVPTMSIFDILNYTNGTVAKTMIQQIVNSRTSTQGSTALNGWYLNVTGVTTLQMYTSAGTFGADTTITLYGIKAA